METGDSAAGDGDEHEAPDRSSGGMHAAEVLPDLGDGVGARGFCTPFSSLRVFQSLIITS